MTTKTQRKVWRATDGAFEGVLGRFRALESRASVGAGRAPKREPVRTSEKWFLPKN